VALTPSFGRRPIVHIAALLAGFLWAGCTDDGVVAPGSQEASLDLRDLAPDVQLQELAPSIMVLEHNRATLMARPGVVGTAISLTDRGRPAVHLYVDGPILDDTPTEISGMPVLVIETGPIYALQDAQERPSQDVPEGALDPRAPPCGTPPCGGGGGGGGGGGDDGGGSDPTARFDPVPIGVSTGHVDITAGTIGARVLRGGQAYALSNNHVFANSNDASNGDDILQPGPFDGGGSGDHFADLADFVPIVFGGQRNLVDAAIASPNGSRALLASTPSGGYGTPRSSPVAASINMRVMKYGRTTGQTKGRVQAIGATVNVNYGAAGVATFEEQIIIGGGGFSAGGDSGSLIVVERGADARRPVGLLFAGGSGITIANRIQDVLSELQISIDGN